MPHDLIVRQWPLVLTATLVSLALSYWTLVLDPVINIDGTLYIQAAEHFAAGRWSAGIQIYKWPFYSLLVGATSAVTGLGGGHAAYLLNAGLYVLVVLGFAAMVRALGGSGRVLWLAAGLVLLHPVLNEFRPFVIRDIGYWACYLWSLAYLLAYVRHGRAPLLIVGAVLAAVAALFRIEGAILVAVAPACLVAARLRGSMASRVVSLTAAAAVIAVLAAAPLWQYVSEVHVSIDDLLRTPASHWLHSWELLGSQVADRLDALRRELPGLGSTAAALPVYLVVALLMSVLELAKSMGLVYAGVSAWALTRRAEYFEPSVTRWWWLLAGLQAMLVLKFALTSFFLADRYPVALGLTLLAVVPFWVDDMWQRFAALTAGARRTALAVLFLAVVEGVVALDVSTGKQYLKDAGLWLRATAPSGSSVYSNSRILIYYSGLQETRPGAAHTWEAAMHEIWSDSWRDHDFFALAVDESRRRNEVQLLRKLGTSPVSTFSNDDGDRVLIFRPD